VTAPSREKQIEEGQTILLWLMKHPEEWRMLLAMAKLEATTENIRAHYAGDTENCVKCGRLSAVAAYNDEARPLCVRCARGTK